MCKYIEYFPGNDYIVITAAASITSTNSSTSTVSSERVLLKVLNVLGQVVTVKDAFKGEALFHIYSDGTVKVVVK